MTRDEKGRFVNGHPNVGAGRKPRKVEQNYLDILIGAVSQDDWRAIVAKARDQAMRGDQVARKWLSDYIIGPPVQRTENDNSGVVRIVVEYVNKDNTASRPA